MSNLKTILAFIITIFLSSCNNDPKNNDFSETKIYPYTLESKSTINIPIDSITPKETMSLVGFEDENEDYLLFLNPNNQFLVININKEKVVNTMAFDKDGPNGVGKISGFLPLSLDSIFLFPTRENKIFITDTTSNLKSVLTYEIGEEYSNIYAISSLNSQPAIFGDKLISKNVMTGNWREMGSKELGEKGLSHSVDLSTGNADLLPFKYPKDYWDDYKKDFNFSFAIGKDKVVYSFFADNNLYYSTNLKGELNKTQGQSKYFDDSFVEWPLSGTKEERFHYYVGSQHYLSIYYDKYRDVYYRFAYPALEDIDQSELVSLRRHPNRFSIIIFDNNLSIIGERFFEDKNKYVTNNCFVSREGLYISINHPENNQISEDVLSFELLKLESL